MRASDRSMSLPAGGARFSAGACTKSLAASRSAAFPNRTVVYDRPPFGSGHFQLSELSGSGRMHRDHRHDAGARGDGQVVPLTRYEGQSVQLGAARFPFPPPPPPPPPGATSGMN